MRTARMGNAGCGMLLVPYDLPRIVRNLLRIVPDAPRPPIRVTASFAGLKVGQLVADAELTRWRVAATDSEGADLTSEHGTTFRLTDREWKSSSWKRVRAPRKQKEKHVEGEGTLRPLPT